MGKRTLDLGLDFFPQKMRASKLRPRRSVPRPSDWRNRTTTNGGNGPGEINVTTPPSHGSTTVRLTEPELKPKQPAKKRPERNRKKKPTARKETHKAVMREI
jgi:hypothetical protein